MKGVTRSRNSQENLCESWPESNLGSHLVIKIKWQWTNKGKYGMVRISENWNFGLSNFLGWCQAILVSRSWTNNSGDGLSITRGGRYSSAQFHTFKFSLSPVIHCWTPQVLVRPILEEEREEICHWISGQSGEGLAKTIQVVNFREEGAK